MSIIPRFTLAEALASMTFLAILSAIAGRPPTVTLIPLGTLLMPMAVAVLYRGWRGALAAAMIWCYAVVTFAAFVVSLFLFLLLCISLLYGLEFVMP